jgi:SAM-dependent methyltransferase
MDFIYRDIDFRGKTVLDIGGGTGTHSFFAVASGADSVITIEPEGDGGHSDMVATFKLWQSSLGASNTRLVNTTFQDFEPNGQQFDIVLVQDAINHLNEQACIDLRQSSESRKAFESIFRDIAALTVPGGELMISECSSRNLFPLLGLRNPFDPAIEWHKHQPPEVWLEMLELVGFRRESLRWSSPAKLGRAGQVLLGNRLAAFLFTSHFVATLVFDR